MNEEFREVTGQPEIKNGDKKLSKDGLFYYSAIEIKDGIVNAPLYDLSDREAPANRWVYVPVDKWRALADYEVDTS